MGNHFYVVFRLYPTSEVCLLGRGCAWVRNDSGRLYKGRFVAVPGLLEEALAVPVATFGYALAVDAERRAERVGGVCIVVPGAPVDDFAADRAHLAVSSWALEHSAAAAALVRTSHSSPSVTLPE